MSFNIQNINKKIVLFFSLFGFVLGFLSGLFSGNSFINLLLRSILSGVLIGVVIVISNFAIMTFLPELLEADVSDDDHDADSDGQVNIVMPEEGYTVQTDDRYDGSEINGATTSGSKPQGEASVETSFKEIDMDNLKNMSSSGNTEDEQIVQSSDDGQSSYSSHSSATPAEIGEHSVEEMAKAVKTVLKKD